MTRSSATPKLRLVHSITDKPRPTTKANEAMHPVVMSEETFSAKRLRDAAYYSDQHTLLLNMDVREGLKLLEDVGMKVNCIVTSPPFYGQRDYEVTQMRWRHIRMTTLAVSPASADPIPRAPRLPTVRHRLM